MNSKILVNDSCLALFEPFASTKKELLICVLNKTGVEKNKLPFQFILCFCLSLTPSDCA
jgi:hypothetical protein